MTVGIHRKIGIQLKPSTNTHLGRLIAGVIAAAGAGMNPLQQKLINMLQSTTTKVLAVVIHYSLLNSSGICFIALWGKYTKNTAKAVSLTCKMLVKLLRQALMII